VSGDRDHKGAVDKAGPPGLFCLEKRMTTETSHKIPVPYARIGMKGGMLIPSTEVMWAIKDRSQFRASRIYAEWWGGAYLVWYSAYRIVFVYTTNRWYSLKAFPVFNRQDQEMLEQLRDVLHPTLFDREIMLHIVAQRGEEGVVRYMMGLES